MSRSMEEALGQLREEQPDTPEARALRQLREQEAAQNTLRSNTEFAVEREPDAFGQVLRARDQLGMDPATAERNPDEVRRQLSAREALEQLRDPEMQRFFSGRPDALAVARDELGLFSKIRTALGRFLDPDVPREEQFEFERVLRDIPRAAQAETLDMFLGGINSVLEFASRTIAQGPAGTQEAFESLASFFQANRETLKAISAELRPPTEGLSATSTGIISGTSSVAANAPIMALGIAARAPRLGAALMGLLTGANETARVFDETQNLPLAMVQGGAIGTLEGVFEFTPLDDLVDNLGSAPFRQLLFRQLFVEGISEQATTLTQDYIQWVQDNAASGKTLNDYLAERPAAAYQTFVATLVGTSIQTTAAAGLQRLASSGQQQQNISAAQNGQRVLQQLDELARASRTRQRAPQIFGEFIAQNAQGEVRVDANRLVEALQERGVDISEVRRQVPSIDAQLDDALVMGSNVVVPVSEWMSGMAGQEYNQDLIPDTLVGNNEMTGREAEEQRSEEGQIVEEAHGALEELATLEDIREQRMEMEQTISQQLVEAAPQTHSPEDAAFLATIAGQGYQTTGEMMGLSPQEMFQRFPIKEITGAEGNVQFEQTAYHGSPELINRVSLAAVGTRQGADEGTRFGWGVYFAERKDVAEMYKATDGSGRLLTVELATDQDSLLTWEQPLEEQSEKIQKAIAPLAEQLGLSNPTGEQLYKGLIRQAAAARARGEAPLARSASARDVSMFLLSKGIPGLRYLDGFSRAQGEGTFNFTIFDDQLAQTVTFEQEGRAGIQFTPEGAIIRLSEAADLSSFLHESAHLFLEMWTQIAMQPNAPQQIQEHVQTLLDWFGVKDIATWQGMTIDQRREHHERFARGFEQYLFIGKPPIEALRPLFRRFGQWLRAIYQSINNRYFENVQLTPEVTAVMDRMLTTGEQIVAAEQQRLMRPLFESRDRAGMTEEEWAEYQALDLDATDTAIENLQKRSLREMRWLRNLRSRELKKLQKETRERRKAVQQEMEEEIAALPIRIAETFVRTGEAFIDGQQVEREGPHKLGREFLTDEQVEALGTGRGGMVVKNGLHPDDVAQLVGLPSGDALVSQLISLTPLQEEIDARTDQTMLERYGDVFNPDTLETAIDIAIHNDARIRLAALELKALDKSISPQKLQRAAKRYVAEAIGRQEVGRLNVRNFQLAETRSARQSSVALQKGDLVLAAMHKRNQILNGLAAREAAKVLDQIKERNTYVRKFRRPKQALRNAVGGDTIRQIHQLMEQFLLREPVEEVDRPPLQDWIAEQPLVPDVAEWIFNIPQTSIEQLPVSNFFDVMDAIKSVETVGRKRQATLKATRFQTINDAAGAIATRLRNTARKAIPVETVPKKGWRGVIRQFDYTIRTFDNIMRQLDGWTEDVVWETVVRPKNEAADFETVRFARAARELNEIFSSVDHISRTKKTEVPGVGSLTAEARHMIVLFAGSELSYKRLIDNGIVGGPKKLTPQNIQDVIDTLSKEEMDFVQAIWDFNDSFWPEVSAKEKRLLGYAPKRVQPRPIQTLHGEYRGGYQHIQYDPRTGTTPPADEAQDTYDRLRRGRATRATTPRGHVQERVQTVLGRQLRLSYGAIVNAAQDVVSDLAWHEWIVDTERILDNEDVKSAILEHYGAEMHPHLKRQIRQITVGDHSQQADGLARWLRGGYRASVLSFNFMTAVKQLFGAPQAIARQGPWFFVGASRLLGNSLKLENVAKEILDRSPFMQSRFDPKSSITRETNEVRNRVNTQRRATRRLKSGHDFVVNDVGMFMTRNTQFVLDLAIWLGAEAQAVRRGKDPVTAARLADQEVRDTQGSGLRADRTAIENEASREIWTLFWTFFSRTYGQTREIVGKTRSIIDTPTAAVSLLTLLVIPALLEHGVSVLLRSDDPEDELGEASGWFRAVAAYALNTVPYARELSGTVQGYPYSGPAATGAFSTMAQFLEQQLQGDFDERWFESMMDASGVLLHVPSAQLDRSVRGYIEYTETSENPEQILFGPRRKR